MIQETKTAVNPYLGDFVLGAVDGTITTFAVVSGVTGAALQPHIAAILGLANLFADGFSMGVSNYLKAKTDISAKTNPHDAVQPVAAASVTFGAFCLVGLIPLLPFLMFSPEQRFLWSAVFAGIAFFLVGLLKGRVLNRPVLRSGIETLLIGAVAALLAYSIGNYTEQWFSPRI